MKMTGKYGSNPIHFDNSYRAVHGLDEQFQEYKCPVFVGCVVTVSGLGTEERKEVKKLVEKEGTYNSMACHTFVFSSSHIFNPELRFQT